MRNPSADSLPSLPFSRRLEIARQVIAGLAQATRPPVPPGAAQVVAEARAALDRLGGQLGFSQPVAAPAGARAVLLAAAMGCHPCPHMPRGVSAGPIFVRLALRRGDCLACLRATLTLRPPGDDADRCDICGRLGVRTFTPIAAHWGTLVIVGDACPGCWAAAA